MNRNLRCNDCLQTKWVSQKQWRSYCAEYGSPLKVKRNFTCKKCKVLKRDNPFVYYLLFGKPMKKLRTMIKKDFRECNGNLLLLKTKIEQHVKYFNLPNNDILYHTSPYLSMLINISY